MARMRGHRNLNEDKTLYVLRKVLVADGREFQVGDEFPWRELAGVTPRLLRILHSQHRIGHERPDELEGAPEPQRSPVEQKRAEERDKGRKNPKPPTPKLAAARGLS
jgi:hypothetical protein